VTLVSIGLYSRSRTDKQPPLVVAEKHAPAPLPSNSSPQAPEGEPRFSAVVHTPGRLASMQPSKNPRVHVVWVFEEESPSLEGASSRPSSIGI
jgi:hypothetical protein